MSYDSNFAPLAALAQAEEISGNTTLAHNTASGTYKVTGPEGSTSKAAITLTGTGAWLIAYDRDSDKEPFGLTIRHTAFRMIDGLLDETAQPAVAKGLVLSKTNASSGNYLMIISTAAAISVVLCKSGTWTREA